MKALYVGQMLWFFAAPLTPGAVAPPGSFSGHRQLRDASRAGAKDPVEPLRPLISFVRGQLDSGALDLLIVDDSGNVHPTGGVYFWDGSGDAPTVDYCMLPVETVPATGATGSASGATGSASGATGAATNPKPSAAQAKVDMLSKR